MIGMAESVAFVIVFSIIPIPAEAVMFRNIHVYGILVGGAFNFIGAIIGAEVLFLLARGIRVSFIHVSKESFGYRFISRPKSKSRRILILLLARILPVPAKVVDVSAGIIPSISWWDFTWTTAVGIVPYQLFMIWIYHGWQTHSVYIGVIASIVILLCFIFYRCMRK